MIYHFLINPAAGKGNLIDTLEKKVRRVCDARGADYRVHRTTRQGDATAYVRAALEETDERQRFFACGGDGTLCEAINGAPAGDARAEFGVIPIGTGNDFARNFTAPESFFDIEKQLNGTAIALDALAYNDRYALNMINIGFDCNVVEKTGQIKRSPLIPTGLAYIAGVGITLCKPFGTPMHITLEDGTEVKEALLLSAIANGAYCGGGFRAAPRASLTDGLLDLCLIRKVSRVKFLRLVSSYRAGTHLENPLCRDVIRYHQTPSVHFAFEEPVSICVDGEIEMTDHVEIRAVQAAFTFSLPAGSVLREGAADAAEPATV